MKNILLVIVTLGCGIAGGFLMGQVYTKAQAVSVVTDALNQGIDIFKKEEPQ